MILSGSPFANQFLPGRGSSAGSAGIVLPDLVIATIRYYPRSDDPTLELLRQRMVGGKFEGSNTSESSGFVTLHTITAIPPASQFTDVLLPGNTFYRWLRYLSPEGSVGNVAEIELRNAAGKKLTGNIFGFGLPNAGRPEYAFTKAWDGDPATFFDGDAPNGNITGLEITGIDP